MFCRASQTVFPYALLLVYSLTISLSDSTSFDPAYSDARGRAAALGEFNFFSAWMSQPKSQLETFRSWAGKDSDIRYDCISSAKCASTNKTLSAITSRLTISIYVVG